MRIAGALAPVPHGDRTWSMSYPASTMNPPTHLANLRIDDLLAHIGSDAISPGAGVAGALALALAAACACKAVSVSLKHQPDNSELRSALASLRRMASIALADGDRDAEAFEAFIHEKNPSASDRLLCEEERFGALIAACTAAIAEDESKIQPNMAGDICAARALVRAAQQIQERNEAEANASR
jgi:hypothetical protein